MIAFLLTCVFLCCEIVGGTRFTDIMMCSSHYRLYSEITVLDKTWRQEATIQRVLAIVVKIIFLCIGVSVELESDFKRQSSESPCLFASLG
jgi:hypothetical protein